MLAAQTWTEGVGMMMTMRDGGEVAMTMMMMMSEGSVEARDGMTVEEGDQNQGHARRHEGENIEETDTETATTTMIDEETVVEVTMQGGQEVPYLHNHRH